MTDYGKLVNGLYNALGKWSLVAIACDDDVERKGYYWQIGNGRIKRPDKKTRRAIFEAVKLIEPELATLTSTPRDLQRVNVSFDTGIYKRLKTLKNAQQVTWNELAEMMLERMEG